MLSRRLALSIFVLLPYLLLAQAKQGYHITGQLEGLKDGEKVWLNLEPEGKPFIHLDSTIVKKGKFTFQGVLQEGPMKADIRFLYEAKLYSRVFILENAVISIQGKIGDQKDLNQSIRVEGSQSMNEISSLDKAVSLLAYANIKLHGVISPGYLDRLRDSIGYNQQIIYGIMTVRQIFRDALRDVLTKDYTKSPESLPSVYNYYYSSLGHESFWPGVYNSLDEKIKSTYYGKWMRQQLAYCIGNTAPAFTSATPERQTLSLQDVVSKGKLTFIDFWASWCAYCRTMGRNILVPLYQKYHDKGFNILGVSMDDDAAKWEKAIADDHYTWPQVSELKGLGDSIFQLYEEHTPGNVLVDGNGKIVAWNVFDPLELEWYINKYTKQ